MVALRDHVNDFSSFGQPVDKGSSRTFVSHSLINHLHKIFSKDDEEKVSMTRLTWPYRIAYLKR